MSEKPQRPPQSYKDLIAWRTGMAPAKSIYCLTSTCPKEEKSGLISQKRRPAVSALSNIAEGQARRTTGEFVQFISHAEGSVAELDTQLTLSIELGFSSRLDVAEADGLNQELRKMLNALRRAISVSTSQLVTPNF